MPLYRLENPIMPYAWGSRTVIAELTGQPTPSAEPEAELWMGAHPKAPSRVWLSEDDTNAADAAIFRARSRPSLLELVEREPESLLGQNSLERFGAKLPFLMKVLAAEEPLSLQAHPNLEQARRGFEAEEGRGVPRDAPMRNYKDDNHKPELLCALSPFFALSGFRPLRQTLRLFETLDVLELRPFSRRLSALPNASGLRELFGHLLTADRSSVRALVDATLEGCARVHSAQADFSQECAWAVRIGKLYPGDPGVVCALLLNLVRLEPGQALFLDAGNLHAYLQGAGIEVMANSDNVLRGGLTTKHVDVPELLRIVDFTARPIEPIVPEDSAGEKIYRTPAREFQLSRIELAASAHEIAAHPGAEILLCTAGEVDVAERGGAALAMPRGTSVFVAARSGSVRIAGSGTIFRTTIQPDTTH